MATYTIESNVPVPTNSVGRTASTYPIAAMQVGDSFAFPKKSRSNVVAALGRFRKANPDNKAMFITRTVDAEAGTCRIWRTA